jgi:hypothetical protein
MDPVSQSTLSYAIKKAFGQTSGQFTIFFNEGGIRGVKPPLPAGKKLESLATIKHVVQDKEIKRAIIDVVDGLAIHLQLKLI